MSEGKTRHCNYILIISVSAIIGAMALPTGNKVHNGMMSTS